MRTHTPPTTLLALLATPLIALAQANYSESFSNLGSSTASSGGPSALVSRGWIFRNQSRVAGTGVSPYWSEFGSWGQTGSSLSHGQFATWQNSSSKVSAWAILPAIPNQQAGDPLKFWTGAGATVFGTNNATLEVRYAPSGGTGTGSGENDVGSFTTLLMTIPAAGGHPWTERTVNLPGSGRIAFRLVMGAGPTSDVFQGSINIDSLQVGTPPAPPYPVPAAGQTVHWTPAHSPVQIARNGAGQNTLIPADATVIVDPGVEVRVARGAALEVAGTLQFAGSSAAHASLSSASTGAGSVGAVTVLKGGSLSAAFVDVQAFTDLIFGAKAAFADCTFVDPSLPTGFSYSGAGDIGHRITDGNLDYARQVLRLERCAFSQGCSVALLRGWLSARDCSFTRGGVVTTNPGPVGGEALFVIGHADLRNVSVVDAFVDLVEDHAQRRFVGDVSVRGNVFGPGLRLEGGASYLIDPSVALQDNMWPVNFGIRSAGILPGSVLPSAGNQFNEIPDTDDTSPLDERVVWADAGIPYVVSRSDVSHGQITILPGVTVKMQAGQGLFFDTDSHGVAQPIFLGEPGRPVRFIPYDPGVQWSGIGIGDTRWLGTRWDWIEVEHARFGVGSVSLPIAIDNSIFRNNLRALGGASAMTIRKCLFENNVYAYSGEQFAPVHEINGFLDANHPANPNSFINNNGNPGPDYQFSYLPGGGLLARSVHNSIEQTDSDARNNWWGTDSGPFNAVLNPTGQGDSVYFGNDPGGFLLPFLTQPPSTNPPPVVRFITPPLTPAIPGEKIIVQWRAQDDTQITTQRVYFSSGTNLDESMHLLAEIPASARSFEWTVPSIGTNISGAEPFLRVVAVDNLGQEGIADLVAEISNPSVFSGVVTPAPAVTGTLQPGAAVPVCFTTTQFGVALNAAIELDNDETAISLGGVGAAAGVNCMALASQIPDVSTDRARIRYDLVASRNQVKSFYGPYFSIRPDALLGDLPPSVQLTADPTGQAFPAGSSVPLTWTASDDEALRAFDIRASFDGGTRWFIVARDLPPDARSFNWTLPASSGIDGVRVRVVAIDRRFQNSSSESGPFSIQAGEAVTRCSADADGVPGVTVADLFTFLDAWFAQFGSTGSTTGPSADFDHSGLVEVADLFAFLDAWFVQFGNC